VRILLAGGAGFVGSHLAARLLDEGHQVTIVDNLVTGRAVTLRSLEIRYTPDQLEIRIEDACWMSGIDGRVDAVLHFASPAGPLDYLRHPVEMLEAGATATRRLLEIACDKGARFLLASTLDAHGEPPAHARHVNGWERECLSGPRFAHDEAKRHAEALAAAFGRHRGMRVSIARIPETYGPGMRIDDGRIIPKFVLQALRGEPLTVHGSGSRPLGFCYVDDVVEGLLALLWSEIDGPVNLGSPGEHSVLEVAQVVIERTRSSSALRHLRHAGDDEAPLVPRPSSELAQRLLGWEPRTRLEVGLEHTVRDIASRLRSGETASGARAPAFVRSGCAKSAPHAVAAHRGKRELEPVGAGPAPRSRCAHGGSPPL
jgi:dTDP-glucose 4,6-dehydratase